MRKWAKKPTTFAYMCQTTTKCNIYFTCYCHIWKLVHVKIWGNNVSMCQIWKDWHQPCDRDPRTQMTMTPTTTTAQSECTSWVGCWPHQPKILFQSSITCISSGVGWAQRGAQLRHILFSVSISRSHHMNSASHLPPCPCTGAFLTLRPWNSIALSPLKSNLHKSNNSR